MARPGGTDAEIVQGSMRSMNIRFKPARHGLAYRVIDDSCGQEFGIVQRNADGDWMHQWDMSHPQMSGFKTRTDAVVGLLLTWGGRGGAPSNREIYAWVLDK